MNSENYNQTAVQQISEPIVPQKHIPLERIIAVIFLLTGYFICRFFPFSENPMGAAILMFCIAVMALIYLLTIKKDELSFGTVFGGCIPIILSVTLILQNDTEGLLSFCITACYFFSLLYIFAKSCGVLIEKTPGKYFFYDAVKIVFIYPFGNFCRLFTSLFSKRNGKNSKVGKTIVYIFLGLLVAALPVALVILFLSYDESFVNLLGQIFSFEIDDILSHLFSFILGIPLAMMLFSFAFSSVNNDFPSVLTRESAESVSRKSKILPLVLSCVALIPFIVVYVIFFISQKDYYFAAFGGVLPSGYSFSKYAVEGFENLCVVAAINGIVLWVFHCFTKKRNDFQNSIAERIGTVLLSLSTLLLIVTAVAKLVLYINEYGFTLKRFYAGWFMVLLFLVFLAVIIKQFVDKMQLNTVIIIIFAVLFGAIALYDWRGFMADYNVEFYMNGHLDKVSVKPFYEFGDSAVPAMVRFVNGGFDEKGYVSHSLDCYFGHSKEGEIGDPLLSRKRFLSRNIPYYKANAALKELDLGKFEEALTVFKSNREKTDTEPETKQIDIKICNQNVESDLFVYSLFNIFVKDISSGDTYNVVYDAAPLNTFISDDPDVAVIPVILHGPECSDGIIRIDIMVKAFDKQSRIAGVEYETVSITLSVDELEQNGCLFVGYSDEEYWISYED